MTMPDDEEDRVSLAPHRISTSYKPGKPPTRKCGRCKQKFPMPDGWTCKHNMTNKAGDDNGPEPPTLTCFSCGAVVERDWYRARVVGGPCDGQSWWTSRADPEPSRPFTGTINMRWHLGNENENYYLTNDGAEWRHQSPRSGE